MLQLLLLSTALKVTAVTPVPLLETQTQARCWGPGIWPHPLHSRLFSLCQLDPDGNVSGHLFLCPLGTSYSSSSRSCIPVQNKETYHEVPVEEDIRLLQVGATRLTQDIAGQHDCNMAESPYCADSNTLVVCGPKNAFVGIVLCSEQQSSPQECNIHRSTCEPVTVTPPPFTNSVSSTSDSLTITLTNTTAFKATSDSFNVAASNPRTSAATKDTLDSTTTKSQTTDTKLTTVNRATTESSKIFEINLAELEAKLNSSLNTNSLLQIFFPNSSSEKDYSYSLYDSYEYDYDLPDLDKISCMREGIQCADNNTLIDCEQASTEPVFIMSCSSVMQTDDNDDDAYGFCDSSTSTCILSNQGANLSLEVNISSDFSDICGSREGLTCANNETLVACSGENSTNYIILCNGTSTSNTEGDGLYGYCDRHACIVETLHHGNSQQNLLFTDHGTMDTQTPFTTNKSVLMAEDAYGQVPSETTAQSEIYDDSYHKINHQTVADINLIPETVTEDNTTPITAIASAIHSKTITKNNASPQTLQTVSESTQVLSTTFRNVPTTSQMLSETLKNEVYSSATIHPSILRSEYEENVIDEDPLEFTCQKPGIQCIDNITLAACLPNLKISYTVSCNVLLPNAATKNQVVYCDQKLDNCAVAML